MTRRQTVSLASPPEDPRQLKGFPRRIVGPEQTLWRVAALVCFRPEVVINWDLGERPFADQKAVLRVTLLKPPFLVPRSY